MSGSSRLVYRNSGVPSQVVRGSRSKTAVVASAGSTPAPAPPPRVEGKSVLLASLISAAVLYRLDVCRALQMASVASSEATSTGVLLRSFVDTHGPGAALTKGVTAELIKATWIRFIKFYFYPMTLRWLQDAPYARSAHLVVLQMFAAVLSAVPETILIMPLEIAKIQLQIDETNSLKGSMHYALKTFADNYGIYRLFSVGFLATLGRQASWSVGYFAVYPIVEILLRQTAKIPPLNGMKAAAFVKYRIELVLSGFIAGLFATMINTPFDVVRTAIQIQFLKQSSALSHPTIVDTMRFVRNNRGWEGFYAGFAVKALMLSLGASAMSVLVPAIGYALGAEGD